MTLDWWSLGLAAASLIVGAEAGFILAFRLLSDAQCGDCDEKQKEIRRLKGVVDSLVHDRDRQAARAERAERQRDELFMEYQEDAALAREMDAWKRDLDPRLAALTPEQAERLFEKIMESAKPSPVQHYDSLSALIRSTGARP